MAEMTKELARAYPEDSLALQEFSRRRDAGGGALPENIASYERWSSLAAGAGLVLLGLRQGKLAGLVTAGVGGALLYRGVTKHCHLYDLFGIDTSQRRPNSAVPAQQGVHVQRSVTINRPPRELYAFWRKLENLPQVMSHLRRVEAAENGHSHWTAEGPLGMSVEWDAEIINDRDAEVIAWRSLPGGSVDTAGSVHFRPLPHDRGTEVRVSMKYNPPAGKLGEGIARLLGGGLEHRITEDLYRFKSTMEAGEAPTTEGQPSGG